MHRAIIPATLPYVVNGDHVTDFEVEIEIDVRDHEPTINDSTEFHVVALARKPDGSIERPVRFCRSATTFRSGHPIWEILVGCLEEELYELKHSHGWRVVA